jgi:hypothetical protein
MTGTRHDQFFTFMTTSFRILLIKRNVTDKNCRENKNTQFAFINFFRKLLPFMRKFRKYLVELETPYVTIWRRVTCKIIQAIRSHLATPPLHPLRETCNTFCFPTAKNDFVKPPQWYVIRYTYIACPVAFSVNIMLTLCYRLRTKTRIGWDTILVHFSCILWKECGHILVIWMSVLEYVAIRALTFWKKLLS